MLFGFFRARCPIDTVTREWVDRRWRWLTDEFGADLMIDSPTVLPTDEFFPGHYDGSEDAASAMLHRVCEYMHVSTDLVDLEFFSETGRPDFVNEDGHALAGAAGLYEEGSRHCIKLERGQLAEPMHLVGTLAHELAHARLMGEGRISAEAFDNELVTDLTVVFHGLGIFLANSPRHWRADATVWPGTSVYKPEYMTAPMFGYALALRCWLREEEMPPWRKHMASGVRAEFKQAMKFLAAG